MTMQQVSDIDKQRKHRSTLSLTIFLLLTTFVTGKLLSGSVVLKLDSGPGRIVASIDGINKLEQYFDIMGLILLSSLPNAKSVHQEMDILFMF